ncbi:hypothetical protein GBA52_024739 [Prunus armeniaca]|nr:hypothetical protein GBA52_024739 [Prunus armeniaca]
MDALSLLQLQKWFGAARNLRACLDTITDTDTAEKRVVCETMANESAVKEDEATEGATNEAKDDVVEKVAAPDKQAAAYEQVPEADEQMATADKQVAEADEWVVAADEVSM